MANKTLIHKAIEIYDKEDTNFEKDVLAPYLVYGYVYSTPESLLLFRSTNRNDLENWNTKDRNCWFVEFAAGKDKLTEFIFSMPFYLQFTAWYRGFKNDKKLNIYNTYRILKFGGIDNGST